VKAEATAGRSRFDFILEKDGKPFFLEVKSCTQFGKRIAMFPDAVTARGRRHITELAHHAEKGTPGGILFLIHWPHADYFLPDYHTDPEFTRTLIHQRNKLLITAVSIGWTNDLTLKDDIRKVEIPWRVATEEAKDSGSYLLILELRENMAIDIGKLRTIDFRKGFYIYVGSAKKNLQKRLERHLRKRKNMFWHIDYLRDKAEDCTAIPIRSTDDLECGLSKAIDMITPLSIPGFGSSDCDCTSHLFYMDDNPLKNPFFIDTLLHFRMDRLHERLMTQNP
jgi:sugar fermentation stimulation protein A